MSGPLFTQAEALVSKIKDFEISKDNLSRAERLQLVQSLEKLTLQLKDPKDAIFDHLTNVRIRLSVRCFYNHVDPISFQLCRFFLSSTCEPCWSWRCHRIFPRQGVFRRWN